MLREQAPVLKSVLGGQPCWILSRREDIIKVLMDPATFSSRTTPISNMLFSDPPEHGRLRKMVADMFTRAAVLPLRARIAEQADLLLGSVRQAEGCDVIDDFAGPLTVTMIGLMLGIPVLAVERLRELTRLQMDFVLAIRLGRAPTEEARLGSERLTGFMSEIIRSRQYEDGGVVAALAEQFARGELTQADCAQFAVMLLIAGHSTTTNLIGNAIFLLAQRPQDMERLRGDETFAQAFVEEVLRTRPSFHRSIRVTTRDVDVAGETIPAGAVVRLLLASANRDPAAFQDPETFDPDLKRRQHFSFGQGIHACLGSWLARLEAVTALGVFSRHVAAVAIDPNRLTVAVSGGTFNEFGFEHLPVRLTARTQAEQDREGCGP
ncbi:cytochrome P450 [Lichenicoccus sp.]|uniref:cytochrome P450 n=1 Tax=Lichenicoccus sp. TaxID=2781899 RepID=UPI003D0B66DA